MKIQELKEEERPREKLLCEGEEKLSNAELLAILIGSGVRGTNAIDAARLLLAKCGDSLCSMKCMNMEEICSVPGIGRQKAVTLRAMTELSRRFGVEAEELGTEQINTPHDAFVILRKLMKVQSREECWCLLLKKSRRVIAASKISEGASGMTEINIRSIVRKAIDCSAPLVILSHSHPSGDPRPSVADIKLTNQLRQALETFEISLVDHIIVSDNKYYSFSEEAVSGG